MAKHMLSKCKNRDEMFNLIIEELNCFAYLLMRRRNRKVFFSLLSCKAILKYT